jgi:peptidoglycan-associated lipoprotein
MSATAIGDNQVQKPRIGALVLLISAVLAGCSGTPVAQAPAMSAGVSTAMAKPAPAAPNAGALQPAAASTVAAVVLPLHLDPKSRISTDRSVFFDYDVFTVSADDQKLIERHARHLATLPALAIKIEGNADERGSSEYNLALGQKRAQAVLQALKIYGVRDSQMEAVSWGKERPRATGHDEAAWATNRRADLVYPKQ